MLEIAIVVAIGLFVFTLIWHEGSQPQPLSPEELEAAEVLKRNSFDAFRRRYPSLIRGGVVRCPKCNGSFQFFRRTAYYGLRCHACKTCGERLYYTEA